MGVACGTDGCDRLATAQGLCPACYRRLGSARHPSRAAAVGAVVASRQSVTEPTATSRGQRWTVAEDEHVEATLGQPTEDVALALRRTLHAVHVRRCRVRRQMRGD